MLKAMTMNTRFFAPHLSLGLLLALAIFALSPLLSAQPYTGWNFQFDDGGAVGDNLPGAANSILGNECIQSGPDGSVYVTGYVSDAVTNRDCLTMKIDSRGNLLWSTRYVTNGNDECFNLRLGPSGAVYVSGRAGATVSNYFTAKYDPDTGEELWVVIEDNPIGSDYAYGMDIDANENVYITGQSYRGVATRNDIYTFSYDSDGNLRWTEAIANGNNQEYGFSLRLDSNANVYVCGYQQATGFDGLLMKYDSNGTPDPAWGTGVVFDNGGSDFLFTVSVDANDNPVCCGQTALGTDDALVVRYLPDGTQDWNYEFDAGFIDTFYHFEFDTMGNIHAAGRSDSGADQTNDRNALVVKLQPDGSEIWTAVYDNGLLDETYDLEVDGQGNVFAVGRQANMNGDYDVLLVKFSVSGAEVYVETIDNGARDDAHCITLKDGDETSPIIGGRTNNGTEFDWMIVRYCEGSAPTANADAYASNEDEVLSVLPGMGLLSNDSDPDFGQELTIISYDQTTTAGGTVIVAADGSFSYTPPPEFSGMDSFTYVMDDDNLLSATATVMIDVRFVNDKPTLRGDLCVEVLEGSGAHSFGSWATFTRVGPTNESAQVLSFEILNNSNSALFSVGPVIDSNGTLTFTLADGMTGTAEMTVVGRDDGGTANGGDDSTEETTLIVIVTHVDAPVEEVAVAGNKSGGGGGCAVNAGDSQRFWLLLALALGSLGPAILRRNAA